MKIAFDWGGVLSDSGILRDFANWLIKNNCKVYLIGVVFESDLENRNRAIKETRIDFTEIHHIIDDGNINHGEKKLAIMKKLGCKIIIDDSLNVRDRINKSGLICLKA